MIALYRMGDHCNHWSSDSPRAMRTNGNMIMKKTASTNNATNRCLGLYSRLACSSSLSFKCHLFAVEEFCALTARLSGRGGANKTPSPTRAIAGQAAPVHQGEALSATASVSRHNFQTNGFEDYTEHQKMYRFRLCFPWTFYLCANHTKK